MRGTLGAIALAAVAVTCCAALPLAVAGLGAVALTIVGGAALGAVALAVGGALVVFRFRPRREAPPMPPARPTKEAR